MKTSAWWVVWLSLWVAGCGQGPPKPRFCAKRCTVAADCCPAGATACPGEYPQNYACEEGLCTAPHCTADEHCAPLRGVSGGLGGLAGSGSSHPDAFACVLVDARATCAVRCADDGACGPSGTCAKADDGTRICRTTSICAVDRPCLGGLHCVHGSCRCFMDSDCGENPQVHCINGACGCGSDGDCGPALDVCTDDARYRYPRATGSAGAPRR